MNLPLKHSTDTSNPFSDLWRMGVMENPLSIKDVVGSGIRLLDDKIPNWRDFIRDEIDIEDIETCILGQIAHYKYNKTFGWLLLTLFPSVSVMERAKQSHLHGFDNHLTLFHSGLLNLYWRCKVEEGELVGVNAV